MAEHLTLGSDGSPTQTAVVNVRSLQAIIFDMDGVIVDSEPLHERAFLDIFDELGFGRRHGIHFPDYYGKSDRTVWTDFIARHGSPRSFEELLEWKRRRFSALLQAHQPIFDGLPDLVARLAPRYALAIASGSEHPVIDEVLALKKLRSYFEVVVSSQDVARGKPAPDIFLRAAELLGVDPAACCVIEDSTAGVAGALAAGMQVIGITNSLPPEKLVGATQVVSSYEEIERLLTFGDAACR
jgi:HAD superfamily hydrolase (TIGR01549 family)